MRRSRTPLPLLLLLLLSAPLLAPAGAQGTLEASDPVAVNGLAVSVAEDGSHAGVTARVEAQAIRDGSGRVFVETKPLAQTDMQGSARLAARVAADTLGLDWRDYDFLVVFRSPSTVIGGPSAGAVMALALASALWNLEHPDEPWTPDPRLAATGTINHDGTIGPVGGVPAKATGAARAGLSTVLYPAGQEQAVATRAGGEQVAVDMDDHCRDLGITCRPAATLADLIEAAVGVRVEREEVVVPGTRDLAAQLRPSVEELVGELEDDIAAAEAELDAAGLSADDGRVVEERLDIAGERLADARAAFDREDYYLAATYSFRGNIEATAALWLARLAAGGAERTDVDAALAACEAAITDAGDVPTRADDWNRLFGVAAARVRLDDARALAAQARQQAEAATTATDWQVSVFTSAFCIERAGTVGWWANLPDDLGTGPDVDLDGVVAVVLDEAREAVTYATAVLGTSGGGQERLDVALAAVDDGDPALALLAAVEAQVQAAVVLQTATGLPVPEAVLDAAEQGAARAVARARAAGAEPVLPVSLIELSGEQEGGEALESLWLARSLSLLVGTDLPPPTTATVSGTPFRFVPLEWLVVVGGLGLLVGAGVVAIVWGVTHKPRPERPTFPGQPPEPGAPPVPPAPARPPTGAHPAPRPATPPPAPRFRDEGPAFRVAPPRRVEYAWDDDRDL